MVVKMKKIFRVIICDLCGTKQESFVDVVQLDSILEVYREDYSIKFYRNKNFDTYVIRHKSLKENL